MKIGQNDGARVPAPEGNRQNNSLWYEPGDCRAAIPTVSVTSGTAVVSGAGKVARRPENGVERPLQAVSELQDVDWGSGPVRLEPVGPEPVIRHELAFGWRRRDGRVVSGAEWDAFVEANFPRAFPNGYTIHSVDGGWRAPDGRWVREPARWVVTYVPATQPLVGVTFAALALLWKHVADQDCVLWTRSSAVAVNL